MSRPLAVQFGAGSVGRGFMGQLFTESGYEVAFIDVRSDLVEALNARGEYPLRLVSADETRSVRVTPVRAIDGRDPGQVVTAVRSAAVVATAVGGDVLAKIAIPLACGLAARNDPVNVLICENLPDPGGTLRRLLIEAGGPAIEPVLDSRVGLAPCVISRMVPVPEPDPGRDPMEVVAEPYAVLPVDADALIGPPPAIRGLAPKSPFKAYVALKLFVHNAGHAAAAYAGAQAGVRFIHEAMMNRSIAAHVEAVMDEGATGVRHAYGLPPAELDAYRSDLLERFRNPHLRDTVARVGRDPARKLGPDERLIGAMRLCMAAEHEPLALAATVRSALMFHEPGDLSAERIAELRATFGDRHALTTLCGVVPTDPILDVILGTEGRD